jgi:hypothetical protein
MSYQESQFLKSFEAAGTIGKFALVKIDANNKVVVCTAATDVPMGIAQRSVVSGDLVEVCLAGPSFAIAGGALTLGTHGLLMASTSGKLVALDTSGGGVQYSVAQFIHNETAADGDEILVYFRGASLAV